MRENRNTQSKSLLELVSWNSAHMQMLGFFRRFSESAPEPVTGRSNAQPLYTRIFFFPTFSESASKLVFEESYVLEFNVWLGFDHAVCVERKHKMVKLAF